MSSGILASLHGEVGLYTVLTIFKCFCRDLELLRKIWELPTFWCQQDKACGIYDSVVELGLDPSHVYLKPLFPVGEGQEQKLHSICKVSSNLIHRLTLPRPILEDSPEVTCITKGLGMPGWLPGF